ncbi:MAG: hypothetical protein AB4426_14445 [Xenococcaceae cyanobacterium]
MSLLTPTVFDFCLGRGTRTYIIYLVVKVRRSFPPSVGNRFPPCPGLLGGHDPLIDLERAALLRTFYGWLLFLLLRRGIEK